MTHYNVAILRVDQYGVRSLVSRSVESRDYVRRLGSTTSLSENIIKVWAVGDLASETVYRRQGWLS